MSSGLVVRFVVGGLVVAAVSVVLLAAIVSLADRRARTEEDDRIDLGTARFLEGVAEERLRRWQAQVAQVAATTSRLPGQLDDFVQALRCEGFECTPLMPTPNTQELMAVGRDLKPEDRAVRPSSVGILLAARLDDERRAIAVVPPAAVLPKATELFGSARLADAATLVVIDATGRLLASRGPLVQSRLEGSGMLEQLVGAAGKVGVTNVSYDQAPSVMAWAEVRDFRVAVVGPRAVHATSLPSRLLGWSLLVILSLGLLGLIIGSQIASTLLGLRWGLAAVAAGDFQQELPSVGRGELARVCGEFNSMTQALKARDEDVRRRQHAMSEAESAALQKKISERLRKDLAVALESIEDVVKAPMDDRDAAKDLRDRRSRLKELVTRATLSLHQVLALAGVAGRRVDVAALIEDIGQRIRPRAEDAGVHVEIDVANAVLFPRLEVQESDLRELVQVILDRVLEASSSGNVLRVGVILADEALELQVQCPWSEPGLTAMRDTLGELEGLVASLGATATVLDGLTVVAVKIRFAGKSRPKLRAA